MMQIRSLRSWLPVLALFAVSEVARAQTGRLPTPCEESQDSPYGPNPALCGKRNFSLLGLGDNASAGLRAAVSDITFAVASSTPGDRTVMGGNLPVWLKALPTISNRNSARFFEYHFYEAAAKGDWNKMKDSIPSLNNVLGGGYTFASNSSQYNGPDLFTGRDGTIGVLFEGRQSAAGSCLDQLGSFLGYGLTLLAISDCPPTWPSGVWKGAPYFSKDTMAAVMNRVGRNNFAFEFWRVPASSADPDRPFIGTSAQTYASSSDHGRETRLRYGNVIPGGVGTPKLEGYPLGLNWHWDAATFNVGSVARMQLIQATIVNNSKDIYGKGIDYDSLYVGMAMRWLQGDESGLGRRANVHSLPQMGAVVANELGRTSTCDGARFPSGTFGTGCAALSPRVTAGFKVGATGIMFLRSPIGDLRYKQFNDPASPFYQPGHPLSGDTITFNRMSLCGFDCANVQFIPHDTRKAFGTISAREADALDGRDPASLTEYDYWHLFKPVRGTTGQPRVDVQNPRAGGGFPYCVPNWRYTNRPTPVGAPVIPGNDTLFLDDCNPATNTTTALWADTVASREINWAFNLSWQGAGPFPLKAGDTTSLVMAIFAAPDSVQFMALLRDTYDFYQDFYLGPGSPQPVKIQYARVDSGIAGIGQASVTLYLDYSTAFKADPSIPNTAQKLRTAAAGTPNARLVAMNPWLPDSIERKAAGLVDTIFVFKSCNGGVTFTATRTRGVCISDRALDAQGRPVGSGWQAYAAITRNSAGQFPTTFTDNFVVGGQRYLYSFVTKRPALSFTVLDSGTLGTDPTRRLITRTYTVLEAGQSTLSTNRSAPNVREIYVPVSSQAGSTGNRITVSVLGPTPLRYHAATVVAVDTISSTLNYTAYFGDSIEVETRDYTSRAVPDTTTFYLFRSARIGFTATGAALRIPRDTLIFRTAQLLGVNGAGTLTRQSTSVTTVNGQPVTISRYTVPTLSSVVAQTDTRAPFFATTSLATTTGFQNPAALSQPGAPPLIFQIASRNGFFEQFWSEQGFVRLRSTSNPSIGSSVVGVSTGAANGEYVMSWRAQTFGALSPFTLDLANPSATEGVVIQSLNTRARADSTSVTQETVDVINKSLGTAYTTNDLAKIYLPFVTRNIIEDEAGKPVTMAVLKSSLLPRIILGTGLDTLGVAVPAHVWVPGTPLIVIEDVTVSDTLNGRPIVVNGVLQKRTEQRVTFRSLTIGCSTTRTTCNPVTGVGASAYVEVRPPQSQHFRFYNPYTSESEIAFKVEPALVGTRLTNVSSRNLDDVKVVPNPYVVASSFEYSVGTEERRLLFSHVPPQGIIRIYTASGGFVQQLTWTPNMLNGNGDLFWDMRTRENFDIGPGLYLFTVESTGPGRAKRKSPGKFIIIK